MKEAKEYLMNAETALFNERYTEALIWYRKALQQEPDNLYVLSRMGAIYISQDNSDEAMKCFQRAYELDPANGDNAFNLGNAYFYQRDAVGAFNWYVEAEKLGVSENVLPRLYYQMSLLCSIRSDVKSALIYIKKCEEADKDGKFTLNPDLISEKIKLYMMSEDFAAAAKCASQLVAAQPGEFANYMTEFSLLMAGSDYAAAEKCLRNCQSYAEMDDPRKALLSIQFAVLYNNMADADPEKRAELLQKGAELLEKQLEAPGMTSDTTLQCLQNLSEIYMKQERYEDCERCLDRILGREEKKPEAPTAPAEGGTDAELTEEDLDAMLERDLQSVQEKIDSGELDPDLGLYAMTDYDEEGNPIHVYEEGSFGEGEAPAEAPAEEEPEEPGSPENTAQPVFDLTAAMREKAVSTYLSCCLARDDFKAAAAWADELKSSSTASYAYYGMYCSAMISRKLEGDTEAVRRKYAEAIAYFRSKAFTDSRDTLASLFRGRLYAEEGKYEKAKEIASLLSEGDQRALLSYVEQCQKA